MSTTAADQNENSNDNTGVGLLIEIRDLKQRLIKPIVNVINMQTVKVTMTIY